MYRQVRDIIKQFRDRSRGGDDLRVDGCAEWNPGPCDHLVSFMRAFVSTLSACVFVLLELYRKTQFTATHSVVFGIELTKFVFLVIWDEQLIF